MQAHRSTWTLFFAVAWMTCAPISVCWVGPLFSKLWCPMQAAGKVSLQTGTVWVKLCCEVGMPLGTNFSHRIHLSVSTVVYDSVSLILYKLILLFRLHFVISCHAQLATLACAKMRAVWWGKSSEKPWQKNPRYVNIDPGCNRGYVVIFLYLAQLNHGEYGNTIVFLVLPARRVRTR